MRSTFAGLNTMVSGIQTYSLGLNTVGHNMTNAATKGYSRQTNNIAAVAASNISTYYGTAVVGNGTGTLAIQRARDSYADKQYWRESSAKGYYETRLKNYQKMEEIFNDTSDNGLQSSLSAFYASWVDLSANASITANRTAVIEKGKILAEKIQLNASQTQEQIIAEYSDLALNVERVNKITDTIVDLNKSILTIEATGASANDLRDQRDLLTDELAEYMNINVYEDGQGMYTIVANGTSIVNGITNLHLELGNATNNTIYGVTDYTLSIVETGTYFDSLEGILKANIENIATDKEYIDTLADISSFLLTTLNDQHKAGAGMDNGATTDKNFYGEDDTEFTWSLIPGSTTNYALTATDKATGTATILRGINAIDAIHVNTLLSAAGGEKYVAARSFEFALNPDGTVQTQPRTIVVNPGPPPVTQPVIGNDGQPVMEPVYVLDANNQKIPNGTGDGSNATLISILFNLNQADIRPSKGGGQPNNVERSVGDISLNTYYNNVMTDLGINTEVTKDNLDYEESMIEQINNWRESTSGVNWNEELTYMITFQTGYNACSRCLTTMDEMLDRLINSTGVVGR